VKALCALFLVACHARSPRFPQPDAQLHLIDKAAGIDRVFIKRDLHPFELVDNFDPYYGRQKRFWAVPLAPLLHHAFPGELDAADLLFRAQDGYAVPFVGARVLDGTAWLAIADADHVREWDSIGPRQSDPSPFYVVWSGPDRADLERFPRPWGLVSIERAPFAVVHPHMVPTGGGDSAQKGFALFRRECVACHAINREGGRIGPELNVPQSIVEYRPREQIRAYIRDPLTFRYGTMPAHPDLSDGDLDSLLAYFDHMRAHKFDPEAKQ
jgi:hypothetical protein